MNKEILIQNTKTLESLLDSKLPPLNKFDVIVQIRHNLKLLKDILETNEYNEFKKLEERVNKIIEKLMDRNFVTKIQDLLTSL